MSSGQVKMLQEEAEAEVERHPPVSPAAQQLKYQRVPRLLLHQRLQARQFQNMGNVAVPPGQELVSVLPGVRARLARSIIRNVCKPRTN